MTCEKCGNTLEINDWPFCPHGPSGTFNVIGDECDITIKHGICWDDGTPRRYRSKVEMKRVMKEKGLENKVEHLGENGTDKSRFTTRWT